MNLRFHNSNLLSESHGVYSHDLIRRRAVSGKSLTVNEAMRNRPLGDSHSMVQGVHAHRPKNLAAAADRTDSV